MRRWLPLPFFSALLAALWLLLNDTLAPLHLVVAGAAGIGGGWLMQRIERPLHRARRRWAAALTLFALVVDDIVRSNIAVARITLRPSTRGRTPGFVAIPLELRHPAALAILACIVTATPGTSWAHYDAARNVLTLHMLELAEPDSWIAEFKARYERRLLEIFP
jgi:multicomponent K+:H+ antiporter subunit E